jgi:hypothetical protein
MKITFKQGRKVYLVHGSLYYQVEMVEEVPNDPKRVMVKSNVCTTPFPTTYTSLVWTIQEAKNRVATLLAGQKD